MRASRLSSPHASAYAPLLLLQAVAIIAALVMVADVGRAQMQYNEQVTVFSSGASMGAAAVGDFNGDGVDDVLVGSRVDGRLAELRGGPTRLTPTETDFDYIVGLLSLTIPRALAAADMNGDGLDDAIGGFQGGQGVLILESPSWTLAAELTHPSLNVDNQFVNIHTLDFNADGALDVVVHTFSTRAAVLFLRPGGALSPWNNGTLLPLAPSLGEARGMSVGDVNNDGISDILVADNNVVNAYFGNTGGVVVRSQFVDVGSFVGFVAAGDLDGDGFTDVVHAFGSTIRAVFNPTNATSLSGGSTLSSPPATVASLQLVDLNNDARLDLLCLSVNGMATVYVNAGSGPGMFATNFVASAALTSAVVVVPVDLDGDGDLDLISGAFGSLVYLMWIPSLLESTVAIPPSVAWGEPVSTQFALRNADGTGFFGSIANILVASVSGLGLINVSVTETRLYGNTTAVDLVFVPTTTVDHTTTLSLQIEGNPLGVFAGTPAVSTVTCPSATVKGLVSCTGCPADQFALISDAGITCVLCPPLMTSPPDSSAFTDCECPVDKWFGPGPRQLGAQCVDCPAGAVCPGGKAAPYAAAGFFPSPADPATFVQCLGRGCGPNATCTLGFKQGSYLCSDCASGFYPDTMSTCSRCPNGAVGLFVGGVLAMILVSMLSGGVVAYGVGRTATLLHVETSTPVEALRQRTLPVALSIVAGALQIAGAIGTLDVSWPSSSDSILAAFAVLAVDTRVILSQCVFSSFSAVYLFGVMLPLVFLAVAVLTSGVVKLAGLASLGTVSLSALVTATFVSLFPYVYLPLARAALLVYGCQTLPGGDTVVSADHGVVCFDSTWWGLAVIGALFIIVFILGVPAVIVILLVKPRAIELVDPHRVLRFGSLFRNYRLIYSATEVGLMLQRLAVVIAVTFFASTPGVQLMLVALAVGGGLVVVSSYQPYVVPAFNTLFVTLMGSLLFVVTLALAKYAEQRERAAEHALSVCLGIAVFVLVFVGALAVVVDTALLCALRRGKTTGEGSRFISRAAALRRLVRLEQMESGGTQSNGGSDVALAEL